MFPTGLQADEWRVMTWPMKVCLYLCVGLLMRIALVLEGHVACPTDQPKKSSLAAVAVLWPLALALILIGGVVVKGDDYRCSSKE